MSFTVFSVAVILIFVTVMLIEIFQGLKKGYMKTLISLGTKLFSVLLSAVLAPLASKPLVEIVWKQIEHRDILPNEIKDSEAYTVLIMMLTSIVVSTVLFVLLFFFVKEMTELILAVVYRARLKLRKDDPGYRTVNASWLERNGKTVAIIASVISAFLITTVLVSPLMGTMEVALYVVDTVETLDEDVLEGLTEVEDTLKDVEKYSKDPAANLFYQFGGKQMYRSVARTSRDGVTVYLFDELELLKNTAVDLVDVLPSFSDPAHTSKKQLKKIETICENVEQMGMSHLLLTEYLSHAADAWQTRGVYKGIDRPVFNDVIDPTFEEILKVCAETDVNSVKPNAVTLLKVYSLILKSDVLDLDADDYNEMMSFFDDGTLIKEMKAILMENPYMTTVVDRIPAIVIDILADHINVYEFGAEKYELLMENMADALDKVLTRGYATSEEQLTVLSDYAKDYLTDYGLEVPDAAVELVADELLTSVVPEEGEISAESIKSFFANYGN